MKILVSTQTETPCLWWNLACPLQAPLYLGIETITKRNQTKTLWLEEISVIVAVTVPRFKTLPVDCNIWQETSYAIAAQGLGIWLPIEILSTLIGVVAGPSVFRFLFSFASKYENMYIIINDFFLSSL